MPNKKERGIRGTKNLADTNQKRTTTIENVVTITKITADKMARVIAITKVTKEATYRG